MTCEDPPSFKTPKSDEVNWRACRTMPTSAARRPPPPSERPALPGPPMGRYKPTNLAKVGLTLSDS
jgi:hypothetical protein